MKGEWDSLTGSHAINAANVVIPLPNLYSAKSNTKKINFELSMNYVEWIKTTVMAKVRAR